VELKPGYKQTEVGVIPEDWEVAQLATVCSMKSGEGITSASIDRFAEYPCYGGNGLRGFTTRFTHNGCYALIGRQGALCGNVVGVEGKLFASEHAIVVTASPRTDIRWLTVLLGAMRLNQYSESSAQPGLSVLKLLSLEVSRPPTKTEQKAIAEALSDADALIESLEQLVAKKRHVKQGAMQELLTGKKRLPGFQLKPGDKQTEVGQVPEDWELHSVGTLGVWKGGATPSMLNSTFWKNGSIPWVSSGDVKRPLIFDTEMRITDTAVKNSSTTLLPTDSIILVIRSGILRKFLPVAMNAGPVAINQDIKGLIAGADYVPNYLFHLLVYSGPRILATCLKSGTTVESIEFSWLKSFRVAIPPMKAEQEAIAAILWDMDAEIAALEVKLAKARQLKQGMMQELLTGRIRLV
jgi:type I restriction enzyme S subunit